MPTHPTLNNFFGLLDKWRHFPAFPLEPRSEVLFALFLPTVMKKCIGVGVKSQIIPQFPLKKKNNYQSDKVDFFALSEDGNKGFFIELKTDMKSRRKGQDCYLKKAIKKGIADILCDLKEIVRVSNEKQKYYYLLNTLSDLDLIKLNNDLKVKTFPKAVSGVSKCIEAICIVNPSPSCLEVVYIQPRKSKDDKRDDERFHYIYFKEFADCIKNQGDMGKMFAGYLKKWIEDPANQPPS